MKSPRARGDIKRRNNSGKLVSGAGEEKKRQLVSTSKHAIGKGPMGPKTWGQRGRGTHKEEKTGRPAPKTPQTGGDLQLTPACVEEHHGRRKGEKGRVFDEAWAVIGKEERSQGISKKSGCLFRRLLRGSKYAM